VSDQGYQSTVVDINGHVDGLPVATTMDPEFSQTMSITNKFYSILGKYVGWIEFSEQGLS
jgi:hypothetical protein